jgi:hypothetical protein
MIYTQIVFDSDYCLYNDNKEKLNKLYKIHIFFRI